jgi:exodeoxyribonuclease VII small subunit
MIMAETPSFEEALVELEDIVTQLEAGDLSLEESLALFERGQRLAVLCNQVLDKAELRLEQIGSGESFSDSKQE